MLRQLLLNNLWYGENSREANRRQFYASMGLTAPAVISLIYPDMSRVWGIDISHWNGLTNLQEAKDRGCSFVFIKAADGSVPSRWFPENKARAKAAGLPWGVYDWLYPGAKVSITSQVATWWNLVKNDYPPMGVKIDFEWTNYAGRPANPTAGDLTAATDKWKAVSGRRAGVYSSWGYTSTYAPAFRDWDDFDLWAAHYDVPAPRLPAGATKWQFWQFTDSLAGDIAPSENLALDGNYYNGSRDQFAAEFGGAVQPPIGGTMLYGRVNTAALNVRAGAGVGSPDIGDLIMGDHVIASEMLNGWWHLTLAERGGWSGTPVVLTDGETVAGRASVTNDVWCSGAYMTAIDPPPTPPQPSTDWPPYFLLVNPSGAQKRYNREP